VEGFDLAVVLTAAGATVSAALIASVIEVFKKAAFVGTWVDAQHEVLVSYVLAAALVVLAVLATHQTLNVLSVFSDFLAWLAIAKLAGAAHHTGTSAMAKLSGQG
jgi:hypothetical protein